MKRVPLKRFISHYTVPDGQAFAPHVSSFLKDMEIARQEAHYMFPQASASMPIINNIISAHIKVHRNVRDKDINKNIKNKSSNVLETYIKFQCLLHLLLNPAFEEHGVVLDIGGITQDRQRCKHGTA